MNKFCISTLIYLTCTSISYGVTCPKGAPLLILQYGTKYASWFATKYRIKLFIIFNLCIYMINKHAVNGIIIAI
jgi:hypothetical protein